MTSPSEVPRWVAVRPASIDDAALLRQWRAEPSVRRFQPLHDIAIAQLRADIAAQKPTDLYRGRGERFTWMVEIEGDPGGWITLVVVNWEHGLCELGYALSSRFQGQGVMTEALSTLLPELLLRTPLHRIEARCAHENLSSQRVLEKLGFVQEGRLRSYFVLHGARQDHLLYSLLREDYIPGLR